MRRGIAILRDRCRYLTFIELLALLRDACFRNETVLIYCALLQRPSAGGRDDHQRHPVVKGELAQLKHARERSERVPWEFQCDLYDGVKDYFAHFDAETGAIGHISWLYYSRDPNRTLRLGDRECEVMFCLTLPEYRGRGLYPAALRAIQRYLKERGYERCFICATKDNLPSIHGIEKSGFRLAGTTRFRKLFGLQISRRRDTRHLIVA
jgi:RimJ/RimL family protein N-acetyltransferase